MATYRLEDIYVGFAVETEFLTEQFRTPLPGKPFDTQCAEPHKMTRQMCAVRLHDAWARFCRELVIQSASREPIDISGATIPLAPGIASPVDVIPTLLATFAKKRFEPRWYDASECIDAAQRLRLANYRSISTALSITPSPADDLRTVRNFVAHRNKQSALNVRSLKKKLGVSDRASLDDLLTFPSSGAVELLVVWIYQLRNIAKIATA